MTGAEVWSVPYHLLGKSADMLTKPCTAGNLAQTALKKDKSARQETTDEYIPPTAATHLQQQQQLIRARRGHDRGYGQLCAVLQKNAGIVTLTFVRKLTRYKLHWGVGWGWGCVC